MRQLAHLGVARLTDAHIRGDLGKGKQPPRRRRPDAEDVRQSHLDALVVRDVDAGDACHFCRLPLSLLVFGVLADHPDDAGTAQGLALRAHLLDGGADFHDRFLGKQGLGIRLRGGNA